MTKRDLRERMLAGEMLAGTFLKTPAYELIEVLAGSGLDFVCHGIMAIRLSPMTASPDSNKTEMLPFE